MPQIFEEHDGIVKEKTAEYQKALKLRRERFLEELEAYNHQVNWNICMIGFKILKKQNRKIFIGYLLYFRWMISILMEM